MSTIATYTVQGMTCSHCVSSVKGALGSLDGVSAVDVHLESGQVTVTSDSPLDGDVVKAAVDDAGYEVAS